MTKIAIIGGSGISDSPNFSNLEWKTLDTGKGIVEYRTGDDGVIFIPRHGHKTRYGPSCTQYAANIIAARALGADAVVAISAVGSLKREINVGSIVIPEDYIDETGRNDNLYGKGFVIHLNPRPAFSKELSDILIETARDFKDFKGMHASAVYVVIPGDRFGTTAEGVKRAQYADIVGMTICPEASMAMQAGMHYAVVAFPVDNDVDANHEDCTLAVMQKLSAVVPDYIDAVIKKASRVNFPALGQLKGNIIFRNLDAIENNYLKRIAEQLVKKYCDK